MELDRGYIYAHEEIVKKVMEEMPDEESLYDLAELFKIFGDSTRIKILYVLFESEMCDSGVKWVSVLKRKLG